MIALSLLLCGLQNALFDLPRASQNLKRSILYLNYIATNVRQNFPSKA